MIRMALAVAAGGVVGTLIRFGVSTWVSAQWPKHFYLATLAVNVLGCLLIEHLGHPCSAVGEQSKVPCGPAAKVRERCSTVVLQKQLHNVNVPVP